jgi:hypothetical protein
MKDALRPDRSEPGARDAVEASVPHHQQVCIGGLLHRARPDVVQIHGRAVRIVSDRFAEQVGVHGAGQGVGDYQRRRGEEVHLAVGVDPALEVAVADSTEHTVRSCPVTAALTAGISGPELPMQVVQP